MKILYKICLFLIIAGAAFPVFVLASTTIGWFLADGSNIYDLGQLPKRLILQQFLQDMINSLTLALPLGALAVLDHSLLARFSITRIIAGLSLPIACVALAYWWYGAGKNGLLTAALTGLILWLLYRFMLLFSRRVRHKAAPGTGPGVKQ